MRSSYFSKLVNGPFGDPALYVRAAYRNEAFLFDCGDLHPLSPRELLKVSTLFLSHPHIDHLAGFDTLLRLLLNREKPLRIFGPHGTIDRMENRLGGYVWNLTKGYPFRIEVYERGREMDRKAFFHAEQGFQREGEEILPPREFIVDDTFIRVKSIPLDHGNIVSMAYSFEESLHVAIHKDALLREGFVPGGWLTRFKDLVRLGTSAKEIICVPCADGGKKVFSVDELLIRIAHLERGMKITYVTDASPTHENSEKIIELAADSHLLVIEATFSHEDFDRAKERGHLTATMAGNLARRSRSSRLLVFHHSPRYQERRGCLFEEAMHAFQKESVVSSDKK